MFHEIKPSKGIYPVLFVYGHKHTYLRANAKGHHVWKCKNKSPKYCHGYALTNSMEEDATLIQSPTRHECSEFYRNREAAIKAEKVAANDSKPNLSLPQSTEDEQELRCDLKDIIPKKRGRGVNILRRSNYSKTTQNADGNGSKNVSVDMKAFQSKNKKIINCQKIKC
uniref:FLYWCH-type domain-containing protein n=1 Tax=Panagrolaimus sp. ES5 TaxID=591445 RepID=A0AC34GB24_9BILA